VTSTSDNGGVVHLPAKYSIVNQTVQEMHVLIVPQRNDHAFHQKRVFDARQCVIRPHS
jgi:hypothetical protein